MKDLNILIVEGNVEQDSKIFIEAAGSKVSENLKNVFLKFEPQANIEIIHPGKIEETSVAKQKIQSYDGIAFTGGAMRLNDMTEEIKKHIQFAKDCLESGKKILAICWGLQVCAVASGGKVNKGSKGAHMGIATSVKINDSGMKHPLYKNKKLKFNTPAFNFDEVCEVPPNSVILSSNATNDVMGLAIKYKDSEVWGMQYHSDYEYKQTINLTNLRKEKLLSNNYFQSEQDFSKHISFIKEEKEKLDFENKTLEIRNWLEFLKKE